MSAVIGIGVTSFGPQLDRTIVSLGVEAGIEALRDAGLAPGKVEAGFFANALAARLFGDTTVGQSVFAGLGIEGVPIVNVENACTSGSTALYLAHQAIESQSAEVVLAVGAEKMCVPSLGLIDSGSTELDTQLGLVTPASFALRAARHAYEFGTTPQQLALVAVKSRRHALLNPRAMFRKEESLEEVLGSPLIADPLTRSQCCPIADGAAAVLLVSDRIAAGLRRAVKLRAIVLRSGSREGGVDLARWHTDERTAALAYERAGVGPEELDLIECHDAFTIAELLHYEGLGLCAPGGGGALVESGATALGGRIPVNVSGGLLSRGHPVAATGLAQVHEIAMQLRHEAGARQVEGCRTGLAHCMGGDQAGDAKSCTVAILCR
ncbi:MAG TPA: thiolase family protein [Steroidobacteraceae bacterium]|nr:thiolase family protein [Steroidobacteraceae bacterium]